MQIQCFYQSSGRSLVTEDRPEKVAQLPQDEGQRDKVPDGMIVYCTLAFDATYLSQTGVNVEHKSSDNSSALLMLPLDHILPDLLLCSIVHATRKVDAEILEMRSALCGVMEQQRVHCNFVTTNRDIARDKPHLDGFRAYENCAMGHSLSAIALPVGGGRLTLSPTGQHRIFFI
jgi:hypothetical protein